MNARFKDYVLLNDGSVDYDTVTTWPRTFIYIVEDDSNVIAIEEGKVICDSFTVLVRNVDDTAFLDCLSGICSKPGISRGSRFYVKLPFCGNTEQRYIIRAYNACTFGKRDLVPLHFIKIK